MSRASGPQLQWFRALPLTALQYRRDRLLSQRVREILRSPQGKSANAQTVATQLNISGRTLHRQLKDEGASLQALKDQLRQQAAVEQLRRTRKSIKQIALSAGFQSEKIFSRAFRDWTGQSPTGFRDAS